MGLLNSFSISKSICEHQFFNIFCTDLKLTNFELPIKVEKCSELVY